LFLVSEDHQLTAKAKQILDVITQADGSIDRGGIADALGQRTLNPHDRNLLDALEEMGLIAVDRFTSGGSTFYRYRLPGTRESKDE
jgi:repressor of nif and glnA expression